MPIYDSSGSQGWEGVRESREEGVRESSGRGKGKRERGKGKVESGK